jgi:ubiquitin C-terminal hydrolase
MNSALQCLFHCMPLVRFFLSGSFAVDINKENPLGHGGEIAQVRAHSRVRGIESCEDCCAVFLGSITC